VLALTLDVLQPEYHVYMHVSILSQMFRVYASMYPYLLLARTLHLLQPQWPTEGLSGLIH